MNAQTNVIPIGDPARALRRARGAFVKSLIDSDERSVRFVAHKTGINPTSLGERLSGKTAFLADELELIAVVLKIDPVDFYSRYVAVVPEGSEPSRRLKAAPKTSDGRNASEEEEDSPQITNRSLATVAQLRPRPTTVDRETNATVTHLPVAR